MEAGRRLMEVPKRVAVNLIFHLLPTQAYPATGVESVSGVEGNCRTTRRVGFGAHGRPAGALSFVNSGASPPQATTAQNPPFHEELEKKKTISPQNIKTEHLRKNVWDTRQNYPFAIPFRSSSIYIKACDSYQSLMSVFC